MPRSPGPWGFRDQRCRVSDTSGQPVLVPAAGTTNDTEAARDPRLDFFRGLGLFIILIAHIPWNNWTGWIPARFGHSDATEIFVFCSGAASAIAFYKVFQRRGWWIGTARIVLRIWQIYWCHVGVFLATLVALIALDTTLEDPTRVYGSALGLDPFLTDPRTFLSGLFTLGYVPNSFDILAMYIVILALVPLIAALARIGSGYAMGASVLIWALASQPWLAVVDLPVFGFLDLPADPADPGRVWFFNPFAWQLIFFTGFALTAGWLPHPPARPLWMIVAAAVLIASFLMDRGGAAVPPGPGSVAGLAPLFEPRPAAIAPPGSLDSKTYLGVLRYVHFLALAYLAWALAGDGGRHLRRSGLAGAAITIVRHTGQQSLAVFVASLLIAQLLGVAIAENSIQGPEDPVYTPQWVVNIINLLGFVLIVMVAYSARFFRSQPWSTNTTALYAPVQLSKNRRE